MTTPQAAVIVPVLNRLDLLKDTVASLRAQTIESVEFILVDDGSDAETLSFLATLHSADSRFRVVTKPDGMQRGAQTSRNFGLEQCAAEAVMFLDSDDLLAPDCVADRFAFLKANPKVDVVVGRQVIFNEAEGSVRWVNVHRPEANELDRFLNLASPLDVPWVTGGALFRTLRLIECKIRWMPDLLWQDVVFHMQSLIAGLTIAWAPGKEPDSFYRKHGRDHFGRVLMTSEGMQGIVEVLLWMKAQLTDARLITDARQILLEKALFHTCLLRAADRNDFDLASALLEKAERSQLARHQSINRMRLYLTGRRFLRSSRRATYYWNRFAMRGFLQSYYPAGESTYGTIDVKSQRADDFLAGFGQMRA